LLEAFLDHDISTDEVVITKFSFEYYQWKQPWSYESYSYWRFSLFL
jgi:hypothetical protein